MRFRMLAAAVVAMAPYLSVSQIARGQTPVNSVAAAGPLPSAAHDSLHLPNNALHIQVRRDSSTTNRIPTGVLGVSIGAVLGGVGSGLMSRGSCEQTHCDNILRDALAGAIIGAGVGLLIELAIRHGPPRG